MLENEVEQRLQNSGWENRASVIAIDPELEVWVWSGSPHVDAILGWRDRTPSLRDWLVSESFLKEGELKPDGPKEAVEQALRAVSKARSSSIYRELAEKVSLHHCVDPSFVKFKSVLLGWFTLGN